MRLASRFMGQFPSVIRGKDQVIPALTGDKKIVQRIISGEHTPHLERNVILRRNSGGWSHLELTEDHIRIEYDGITPDFQESAKLFFETDEELTARGIPQIGRASCRERVLMPV